MTRGRNIVILFGCDPRQYLAILRGRFMRIWVEVERASVSMNADGAD